MFGFLSWPLFNEGPPLQSPGPCNVKLGMLVGLVELCSSWVPRDSNIP